MSEALQLLLVNAAAALAAITFLVSLALDLRRGGS
jgi:hypothetical protein